MSWFQSANIASLAKSALKEAQKTIDKALDIRDQEGSQSTNVTAAVATDFFTSWGVAVKNSATKGKSDVKDDKPAFEPSLEDTSEELDLNSTLLDSEPSVLASSSRKQSRVEESISNNLISEISVELIAPMNVKQSSSNSSLTINPQEDSSDDSKFQSLWLLTDSDSFESSIETSANLQTESLDGDSVSIKSQSLCSNSNSQQFFFPQDEDSLTLVPLFSDDGLISGADTITPTPTLDSDSIQEYHDSDVLIVFETDDPVPSEERNQGEAQVHCSPSPSFFENVSPSKIESNVLRESTDGSFEIQMHEDDEDGLRTPYNQCSDDAVTGSTSRIVTNSLDAEFKTQENPSDNSTSFPYLLDIDNDEKFPEILPGRNQEKDGEHIGKEIESVSVITEHSDYSTQLVSPDKASSDTSELDSSKSVSSRATSSISVISEEKESVSASTPSSPNGEIEADTTRSSPSFEVISIQSSIHAGRKHLLDHTLGHAHGHGIPHGHGNSTFDLSGCQTLSSMSMSMIPHSQSVSVTSTPQSHSRSNSNTSSSFDRIDEHRPRSEARSHQHFVSSTSSSDIEVIPLDLVEIRQRRVSVREIDTQTDVEVKDVIVVPAPPSQSIPAKVVQILAEKDAEIVQLREEGEKLSKKQFDLSTIIKKLRIKEKDTENIVKGLKLELSTSKNEIERLMKSFVHKEGLEQVQNETIGRINQEKRKLECLVDQLRSELEDARENTLSMKNSLEDASIEILELQNSLSTVQRDTAELDCLTKEKSELINRNESSQKELDHLRTVINSNQINHSTKESELKQQVYSLSLKVHNLENEISDSDSMIADATSPLSLEIEKLQLELKSMERRFEKKENTQVGKIHELESRLKTALDHEKSMRGGTNVLQDTIQRLESQIESLTLENNTLQTQLETEQEDKVMAVEKLSKVLILEKDYKSVNIQLTKASNEITTLQNDLKNERTLFETERKKNQSMIEQFVNNGNTHNRNHPNIFSSGKQPHSEENSPSNSVISEASYLEEVFDPNGGLNHNNVSMTPKFYESFSSTMNLYDSIHAQLRQRELEVLQFQDEVCKNEKIRKTLNDEIAHLTVQNQELLMQMERLDDVQTSLAEVHKNYNAVLQMYGEKVEEADELRMDLQDVKEMYKLQIEQLLKKA